MRSRLTSAFAVLGVVVLLLVAGNTAAYASGGHSFFLGKSNHTKKQTTLTRTRPGPVLSLNAKPGSPALAVNSNVKVGNLNADTVDGFDSSQMVNSSQVLTRSITAAVSSFTAEIPMAPGAYHYDYSAFLSGGSAFSYCYLYKSIPFTYYGIVQGNFGASSPGLSASGVLTKSAGDHVYLICGSATPFTTNAAAPIQVVLQSTNVSSGSTFRTQPGGRAPAAN